jgi:hypothetical protein
MRSSSVIRFRDVRRVKYHYIKSRPTYGEAYSLCGIKVSYKNVVEPQDKPADDVCRQCIRKLNTIRR